MFVEKTASVNKNFQKHAQKYFLAPAELVDFKHAPETSAELINHWVENQTNNKIQNIIPPGNVRFYSNDFVLV